MEKNSFKMINDYASIINEEFEKKKKKIKIVIP